MLSVKYRKTGKKTEESKFSSGKLGPEGVLITGMGRMTITEPILPAMSPVSPLKPLAATTTTNNHHFPSTVPQVTLIKVHENLTDEHSFEQQRKAVFHAVFKGSHR